MKKTLLALSFLSFLSVKATDYYLTANTTAPHNLAAWTQDPTGLTAVGTPTTFTGLHTWHFKNRTGATLTNLFNISSAATSSIGSGNTSFSLNVTGNTAIGGQINGLIDITSTGTVIVSNAKSYKWNNLHESSLVVFNFATAFMRGTLNHYGRVTIATSCSLDASTIDVYVDGILTINTSQTLNFNGYGIYLNGSSGSIAGAGVFSNDPAGFIAFLNGNGGNNGTVNFAGSTGTINGLYFLFNTGADYVSLGTDVVLTNGGIYHSLGSINLNGHSMTIDATSDISFPSVASDGTIMGSNASALYILGTIGLNGGSALFMDPANSTLNVLGLNAASTLDIGNTLSITDSLSILSGGTINTNSNLTLISTSAKKGRLGRITGSLNGDITVQTFARGGITDWVNIGVSGVTGETINSGWYGQIPMCVEGSATGVTSANNQYFESIQRWNENVSYYDTLVTVTDNLVPGEGYWVFLGNSLYTTSDMIWTVSGAAVTGPHPINLTNSNVTSAASGPGFNLIANPFASPINWNSVITNNNNSAVNDAYYIYDPDLGSTVSFVNGVASPASGTLTNYQAMADIIPMGQAFYVEVTASTTLIFDEMDKSNRNTSNFQLLKTNQSSNSSNPNIGSPIRLNIDGQGYHDDAVIRFHSNATSAFDKSLDAHKIYTSPGYAGYPGQWTARTCIATQSNNEDFSINSIPFAHTQNAVIPVIARVYVSGQHTISASELQNLPPGTCVDLKDLYNNSIHDLTQGDYVVNMSDTTFYPRFELTVCANVLTNLSNNTTVKKEDVRIGKDDMGLFVDFDYSTPTEATISACNILGQTIMTPKKVKAAKETTYLNISGNDQLIFVTVETNNNRVTKKILNK